MREPGGRGEPITEDRLSGWADRFRFYREPPGRDDLERWIQRFSQPDRDLAARVLDCVEVVSTNQIMQGYAAALNALPGWHREKAQRTGSWYFVGYGSASESGPAMLSVFREANNMKSSRFNDDFKSAVDLPSLGLTAEDTVVFVDDFSGSGKQVCDYWPQTSELLGADPNVFLILVGATVDAIGLIGRDTDLEVRSQFTLGHDDNVFRDECVHFDDAEKERLRVYGKKADARNPEGFRGCGLVFVLAHTTPNNSIPILHVNKKAWRGPFPRYLRAA